MMTGRGRKPFFSTLNSEASGAPSSGSGNCAIAGHAALKARNAASPRSTLADRDGEDGVAAHDVERERSLRAQRLDERLHGGDPPLVDTEDHVALAQAVIERFRAGLHRGD